MYELDGGAQTCSTRGKKNLLMGIYFMGVGCKKDESIHFVKMKLKI